LALAIAVATAIGCESVQQKCDKARAAATAGWTGYVEALQKARAAAVAVQSETHQKLSHDVELRLSPAAQKLADGRYDRSSEAWRRAHEAALNDACKHDSECSTLKQRNGDAQRTIADLDERLPLARAARAALELGPQQAKQAAQAAIVHPEFPLLKQAQSATAAVYELCGELEH
jgi:hypothetical protein